MKHFNVTDTICAISTPAGVGGIAIIRISGKDAIEICDKIFIAKNGIQLTQTEVNKVIFGAITNYESENNRQSPIANNNSQHSTLNSQLIDEVLVTVFRAPHSFTGEDTVEISCHGSLFIQQEILKILVGNGCRLAMAGEFTQRAFLNGKMDLSQAEAVADLIASQNEAAHKIAMSQMRGGFSSELQKLRSQLLDFVSLVELELDFSEEDIVFANRNKLREFAQVIFEKINTLTNSFSVGNVLKNGIPVALVGETNVGKSTLLNVMLNEEKAIVSDVHGTTRDVIEDCVNIQGITFRFIDTAGIRNTKDTIENLGIERTYQQIEKASIVLWLIDGTQVSEHIEWLTEKILHRATGKKIILVFNKIDCLSDEELEILNSLFEPFNCERIEISAKNKINTEKLEQALLRTVALPEFAQNDIIVSNIRHYEAFKNTQTAVKRVIEGLTNGISGEFLSQDIRECLHYLGEITGEITTDEILGNIFKNFCIGK
ncbi:MAG: tRNA uridine-5-carboxymethylaminomethyl(34) synthesis GTPase MnmE [Prevotellaceae bacterium]|nr:tRNA uridine-5-carboxymethylaminomethyl(34) synthesis GTPase MnmE [Prevotellaceae bacterium]